MVIELPPDVEGRLQQIAEHEGKSVSTLVIESALALHEDHVRFRQGVAEGLRQADAGEFVDEREMQARWQRLLGQR
jgi:predicted transcriptional regulator